MQMLILQSVLIKHYTSGDALIMNNLKSVVLVVAGKDRSLLFILTLFLFLNVIGLISFI